MLCSLNIKYFLLFITLQFLFSNKNYLSFSFVYGLSKTWSIIKIVNLNKLRRSTSNNLLNISEWLQREPYEILKYINKHGYYHIQKIFKHKNCKNIICNFSNLWFKFSINRLIRKSDWLFRKVIWMYCLWYEIL